MADEYICRLDLLTQISNLQTQIGNLQIQISILEQEKASLQSLNEKVVGDLAALQAIEIKYDMIMDWGIDNKADSLTAYIDGLGK